LQNPTAEENADDTANREQAYRQNCRIQPQLEQKKRRRYGAVL